MKINFKFNKKSQLHYGIGANHDFAGCIVKDGKIVMAIEAERINRIKHGSGGFNTFASVSKYLFAKKTSEIHSIATCDTLQTRNVSEYLDHVKFYNHHLCHAAAVFYNSPFTESAILVMDGLGSRKQNTNGNYEFETISMYFGKGTKIQELKKVFGNVNSDYDEQHVHKLDIPNSIGIFYTYITKIIGFDFLEDGKTMGLSSYGNSNTFYVELLKYITYRKGVAEISFTESDYHLYRDRVKAVPEHLQFKVRTDFAAAGQRILEEIVLFYAVQLCKITNSKNLCISGGVALNSVANSVMMKRSGFESIFVFPACGDSSVAVGAAMLSYYDVNKTRVTQDYVSPFLGKKYSDKDILNAIRNCRYVEQKNIYKSVAELVHKGEVVGWFQGASEFGPRALGHRSIVANPTDADIKDYINKVIKKREDFRPFAPAVLYSNQTEYFKSGRYNPYMLFVDSVRDDKSREIPAVTHVDRTARVQSVDKKNKEFYKLITEFYKLSGVPMLLNTSFNTIKDEPIVETPEDAVRSFINSNLKYLAIGKYLCYKSA